MESTRQLKFARLIQKELGDILQKDARNLLEGAFITLTRVKVTPDLALAKVYLSFLMVKDKQESLNNLSSHNKAIRKMLGERIRKQVRIIPELQFYIDDNLEYAARMDQIISKLNIPPATEEDEKDKDKEED